MEGPDQSYNDVIKDHDVIRLPRPQPNQRPLLDEMTARDATRWKDQTNPIDDVNAGRRRPDTNGNSRAQKTKCTVSHDIVHVNAS